MGGKNTRRGQPRRVRRHFKATANFIAWSRRSVPIVPPVFVPPQFEAEGPFKTLQMTGECLVYLLWVRWRWGFGVQRLGVL